MSGHLNKRKILTLCGSSRFREDHERAQMTLTLQDIIVIPMGMYGHLIPGFNMTGEVKAMLDRLHFAKIDISDGIYVVNPKVWLHVHCGKPVRHLGNTIKDGEHQEFWQCDECKEGSYDLRKYQECYVGWSTKNEIEYARSQGKEIHWLNKPGE